MGVVVAISPARHAGHNPHEQKLFSVGAGSVLRPTIRVGDSLPGSDILLAQAHIESLSHELGPHIVVSRKAHNLSGKDIKKNSQESKSLLGRNVRNISGPNLIWGPDICNVLGLVKSLSNRQVVI